MEPELTLDSYEAPTGQRWCWKYGPWSSAEYPTEQAALHALSERALAFSQLDGYDPYQAALVRAKVNSGLEPPFDLWLVEGAFYCAPGLEGIQLGEDGSFTPPAEARILAITKAEYDAMMMEYSEEHCGFPDN